MTLRRVLVLSVVALLAAGLIGLGVWQVERRAWKLALIAHTERMLRRPPAAAPPPAAWPGIGPGDVYRPVRLSGSYLPGDTLVQAVTELGGGYWVMTPLDTGRFTVLVNRGFVPADRRAAIPRPDRPVTVQGLLRVSEPGGGFLRRNDPAAGRWYSRDVAAIAATRGLTDVAPYFVDEGRAADGDARTWPRAGLTVVRFRNNHLVYALTWFGLAGLLVFLTWRVARRGVRD